MQCENCDNQDPEDFDLHPISGHIECACCGWVERYEDFAWDSRNLSPILNKVQATLTVTT